MPYIYVLHGMVIFVNKMLQIIFSFGNHAYLHVYIIKVNEGQLHNQKYHMVHIPTHILRSYICFCGDTMQVQVTHSIPNRLATLC